jgi:hypothetical protein
MAAHVCEVVHVMQASPLLPHADATVPATHPVSVQHPAQLTDVHPGATQAPPPSGSIAQASPSSAQSAHTAPALPHASACAPPTQIPSRQQPVHDGPQSEGTH